MISYRKVEEEKKGNKEFKKNFILMFSFTAEQFIGN